MRAPSFLRRRGLFAKYFLSLVGIVTLVLLINGAFDMWFAYGTARQALGRLQQEQANGAADKVGQFITEIERQIGWTTHPQWAAAPVDQRRFDFIRLQRQVPAITELSQIDGRGREQLKVSRLAMDVVSSNADMSHDPRFTEVQNKRVWYSPVYLRKESEPYMSISLARTGRQAGATVAEVNLKLIWDVVSAIKAGNKGYAYVVDRDGRLIAHPDISLVLRNTDMSKLGQVKTALEALREGKPLGDAIARFGQASDGTPVLSSVAAIPALGWLVFVEQPTLEALQPLFTSLWQTLALLILGLGVAALGAWFLSRRMASPIRVLSTGAERLGSGDLAHRIDVKTGDEVETLANNFNRMAGQLQESHATLEQRVEDRTRELSESLEQQTATAEILRAISQSPTDVQPVLDAVVKAAVRFCGASDAIITLREGDGAIFAAHEGPLDTAPGSSLPLNRQTAPGRAIVDGQTCHLPDIASLDPVEFAAAHSFAAAHGFRAAVAAPLLHEGIAIGSVALRKPEPGPFTPRQIELLETFAAQAVIAIENVRLFTELRETLEQQTATAGILQVISSSPTDAQPVFDAIAQSALRLLNGWSVLVWRYDGERMRVIASHGGLPESDAASVQAALGEPRPEDLAYPGDAILKRTILQIADVEEAGVPESVREVARARGWRANITVPMLRDSAPIGVITVSRRAPGAFAEREIGLLQTFASQAVIAIENARLFSELRESLEYQTAISDVLKVMSRSTFDLVPVLQTVVVTAARLCNAHMGGIWQLEDGAFRWKAGYALEPRYRESEEATSILPGEDTLVGRVALHGKTVRVEDALGDTTYGPKDMAKIGSVRSMLGVAMTRDGKLTGVMALARDRVQAFTDKEVDVVTVFADQAAIAVENVRLINEIRDKSRQLEIASQHKSQFLANMSHELRTPLNAIIGYTEMMADGLYGKVGEKAQGVLERVQNNSRHLLGLINDVLDLSKIEAGQLTLAVEPYSVADMAATVLSATESLARAKGLALGSAVASGLPTGRGDARRLTQVLLNLVGNAIKFTDSGSVEIRAVQAGDCFELSVVDSGFGISPADQARIFDEFQQVDNSSTRKKGGTGLGLSISRKIVELHGGHISVESEVGQGSTFKVTIPINAAPVVGVAGEAA